MMNKFGRVVLIWLAAALVASTGTPALAAMFLRLPSICDWQAQESVSLEGEGALAGAALLTEADTLSAALGARLLGTMLEASPGNAMASPLGVGAVLAMLAPGATEPVRSGIGAVVGGTEGREGEESVAAHQDDGARAREHLSSADALACQLAALGNAELVDELIELQYANGAFADRRLDLFPAFATVLQDKFGVQVERMDFSDTSAVDRINAWVSDATRGAIPEVVSELEPDDVLVLANAFRFRGEWANRFDPERTEPAPFHLSSGVMIDVPTMNAEALPARYRQGDGFQAVALPYGEGNFEFVVVLPDTGTEPRQALQHLASDAGWLGGQGFRPAKGTLFLPRLSLESEASLLPALQSLGLASALNDTQAFAGIAAPAPILSRVLHRVMLEVDERGTEAAAATAAVMTTRAAVLQEQTFEMRVDRPFALAIRYRPTGAVLVMAWIADPANG